MDDEAGIVDSLERLFRRKYEVIKATSGAEALSILQENRVAVIISDQRMPGMTGVELLRASMIHVPDAIRILLTGYTDIESVIESINKGEVYRYITKPWDPVDLTNTVDKAIEKYELRSELQNKNRALKKALDELKTLDEAKNNFMILINHELKTPLTILTSFTQLLKESPLSEDQMKYLSRIDGALDRLTQIINDVLDLVSAETGLMKVSAKKITTDKLVAGLDLDFSEPAQEKAQKIVVSVDSLPVRADQKIVRSVLSRVVDNAIKFGDRNSEILISTEQQGEAASISVTNRGRPIDPATIEKILKPFNIDENIMNHTKGLGLGLSLSQALLKRMDSQLKLECPKGQVKVSFDLPLA